ncbi:hypothetical protein M5K25_005293 [Dendrobium thyrsiflorum]|uniref:Uncharacterized protein n=1 Tax=Dendrobium thyrsiflorum TaxID=117978 RepID=A0ABD0VP96_DENTH
MRVTSGCLSRVGPPSRPLKVSTVCRGSGSPCNNSREVDTTKLDSSSGASSINNSRAVRLSGSRVLALSVWSDKEGIGMRKVGLLCGSERNISRSARA